MEKRVLFPSSWLPWALFAAAAGDHHGVLFWPAGQACYGRSRCRTRLARPPSGWALRISAISGTTRLTLESFRVTAVFSVLVATLGIGISLVLAIFADRIVRGAMLLQNPADPAVCGGPCGGRCVVGVHVFTLTRGGVVWPAPNRHRMEPFAQLQPRHDTDRVGRRVEADARTTFCSFWRACSRSRAR